jgi:hypothetical protein
VSRFLATSNNVLGGHSILATRLVLATSRALERKLPMSVLLANPSVASMAAAIDRLPNGDDDAAADATPPPLESMPDLLAECVIVLALVFD